MRCNMIQQDTYDMYIYTDVFCVPGEKERCDTINTKTNPTTILHVLLQNLMWLHCCCYTYLYICICLGCVCFRYVTYYFVGNFVSNFSNSLDGIRSFSQPFVLSSVQGWHSVSIALIVLIDKINVCKLVCLPSFNIKIKINNINYTNLKAWK